MRSALPYEGEASALQCAHHATRWQIGHSSGDDDLNGG
jgi:hypothetical protein